MGVDGWGPAEAETGTELGKKEGTAILVQGILVQVTFVQATLVQVAFCPSDFSPSSLLSK